MVVRGGAFQVECTKDKIEYKKDKTWWLTKYQEWGNEKSQKWPQL